jgi:2-keto-4-pentenoate hydratase/2-oxohepta-3-ene-1,7-dioic acid hydratase in catechol pathway
MIAFASQGETLQPGDLIGSGTVGTGCGLELDRWVKPGDLMELEIEKIGVLRNRVVRPTQA